MAFLLSSQPTMPPKRSLCRIPGLIASQSLALPTRLCLAGVAPKKEKAEPGSPAPFCRLHSIFLFEPIYPAASFHHSLPSPGVEGVALGTNLHPDILFGRPGDKSIAASAGNGCFLILWVNVGFHCRSPLFLTPAYYSRLDQIGQSQSPGPGTPTALFLV